MDIKTTYYKLDRDRIIVEIDNTGPRTRWRMCVNGSWSQASTYYEGVLEHKGYGLVSAYWNSELKEFVPFRITYAVEARS